MDRRSVEGSGDGGDHRSAAARHHGVAVSESTVRRYITTTFADQGLEERVTVPRGAVEPGSEAQIDYGKLGMWLDPTSGRRVAVRVFAMILACSRALFVQPVLRMDQTSWNASHVAAFEFFGGIPARLVCDNLKAGVVRPDLYDPQINLAYGELAAFYGTLDHGGRDVPGVQLAGAANRSVAERPDCLFHAPGKSPLDCCLTIPGPPARPHGDAGLRSRRSARPTQLNSHRQSVGPRTGVVPTDPDHFRGAVHAAKRRPSFLTTRSSHTPRESHSQPIGQVFLCNKSIASYAATSTICLSKNDRVDEHFGPFNGRMVERVVQCAP